MPSETFTTVNSRAALFILDALSDVIANILCSDSFFHTPHEVRMLSIGGCNINSAESRKPSAALGIPGILN